MAQDIRVIQMGMGQDKLNKSVKYLELIKEYNLSKEISEQLYYVIANYEIILICDDSTSMKNVIKNSNSDQNPPTRWSELKKLVTSIIMFSTLINDEMDIYFQNRGVIKNVKSITEVQEVFSCEPSGDIRLLEAIRKVYDDKKYLLTLNDQRLLIVILTSDKPSDGSTEELKSMLKNITSNPNVHVSIADCTDNDTHMEWLNELDGQIKNYANTDSYTVELTKVKTTNQGQDFKFYRDHYVIEVLLKSFVKCHFNQNRSNNNQKKCNII